MGILSSFKNQIGRDTGKVVSNLVWGDKHASVFRFAKSRYNANQAQEKIDSEIFEEKIDKAKHFVENNKSDILALKIPQKKDDIIELLHNLKIMITANPWQSITEENNRITNRYSDIVFMKYEQAFLTLKNKFPKEIDIYYYENQLKKLKKIRIYKKFSVIIWIVLFFLSLTIFGIISEIFGK